MHIRGLRQYTCQCITLHGSREDFQARADSLLKLLEQAAASQNDGKDSVAVQTKQYIDEHFTDPMLGLYLLFGRFGTSNYKSPLAECFNLVYYILKSEYKQNQSKEDDHMVRIAAVGDNCIDFYDNLQEFYIGGNPVNVAVYIKRLGGESAYIGAVGNDGYGREVIRQIHAKGVDCSRVKILEGSTAVTHINLTDHERVFGKYEEGVLPLLELSEEDLRFMAGYDIVVSGVWGYADRYFQKLKEYGAVTAMDFSTELDHEMIARIGPYVDYAFFSFEDQKGDVRSFLEEISKRIRRIVIVTLGEHGSMAYDRHRFFSCGIEPCTVVDTMGAGDSYIAGVLYGLAEGRPLPQSMRLGSKNSSITVGYKGAW